MNILVQVFKWLSQLLILFGGTWALISRTHEQDPSTGRRKLTQSGWMKLSILSVGFVLFTLSEFQNQAQQREAIRAREQTIKLRDDAIEKQNAQLEYLRSLFLLQHELSALEVSWPVDRNTFVRSLRAYWKQQVKADRDLGTDLQYIEDAFNHTWLHVRKIASGNFGLQVLVRRVFGMTLMQFSQEQPEWMAFNAAIRSILGDRFEIELAPGVVIADLARKHWPCELNIENFEITFTVEKPGVSLGQLEDASVTFWGGDLEPSRMPKRIRLRSRDPRVTLNQQFEPRWRKVVLFHTKDGDGHEVRYTNLKAGPFALSASIINDLFPRIDRPRGRPK